jgi:ferredoxin-like protein FixX
MVDVTSEGCFCGGQCDVITDAHTDSTVQYSSHDGGYVS